MSNQTAWSEEEREYGIEYYDDGVTLMLGGELDKVSSLPAFYTSKYGKPFPLTVDQTIVLVMSEEDDEELDWHADRVDSAHEFFTTACNVTYDKYKRAIESREAAEHPTSDEQSAA